MKTLWSGMFHGLLRHDNFRAAQAKKYWSINRANFDVERMVQLRQEVYAGTMDVIELGKDYPLDLQLGAIHDASEGTKLLAGVMEALHLGLYFQAVVRTLGSILAPGSVAMPNVHDFFCPNLFVFGHEISLGIELLPLVQESTPCLHKGSKVLVIG